MPKHEKSPGGGASADSERLGPRRSNEYKTEAEAAHQKAVEYLLKGKQAPSPEDVRFLITRSLSRGRERQAEYDALVESYKIGQACSALSKAIRAYSAIGGFLQVEDPDRFLAEVEKLERNNSLALPANRPGRKRLSVLEVALHLEARALVDRYEVGTRNSKLKAVMQMGSMLCGAVGINLKNGVSPKASALACSPEKLRKYQLLPYGLLPFEEEIWDGDKDRYRTTWPPPASMDFESWDDQIYKEGRGHFGSDVS
jgi:hypothetical protein